MALQPHESSWEDAFTRVGRPGRKRYNVLVSNAADELKMGGNTEKAQAWATLALAEATLMCEPPD